MDPRRWEEIRATFDTLVELDAAERGRRLAALGSTDPELRAAVELLLAADSDASARLAPLEAALLPPDGALLDALGLAGRDVAHFQVRETIGLGGVGVVYRAHDTRLGRTVALKFLLPQYSIDGSAKARFIAEARAAAALDHPNLCTIHEVGTTEDGRLFMAMPLYPGETLKARLARGGPLPVPAALDVARQVALGLEAAHGAGIVHRDLKPGNIMLLPDGTVRILDFGLAKARDQSLTGSGVIVGTVSYMAPEQIGGQPVDGRADFWALGVVLYEMLTAHKPFDGEHNIAVAHAVLQRQPVPPSAHRGELSVAVDDVVLRLLQKDPARRYASASEVLADLARARTAPASARDSVRRQLRRARHVLASRKSRLVVVGAAVAVVAAATYAVSGREAASWNADASWDAEASWGSDTNRGASADGDADANRRAGAAWSAMPARTDIAVLPFRDLNGDSSHSRLASALHKEVIAQLTEVAGLKVVGRDSVARYSGSKVPPFKQIAGELSVGSIVDASVEVVGGRVLVKVRLIDAADETELWAGRYDRPLADAVAILDEVPRQIVRRVAATLGPAWR